MKNNSYLCIAFEKKQNNSFVPREKSRGFLCGGQMADKNKTKKAVTTRILSELLLFLCCLTRINSLQYSAIFCNKVTNIYLNGKGFAIAECSKIFISGGQTADTE